MIAITFPSTRNTENSSWEGHEDSVVSCAIFGRGRGQMVLSWSEDSTLRIWELPQVWDDSSVAKAKCLRTFGEDTQGHDKAVRDCVVFDEGTQALSCSDDGSLRVWDLVAQNCSNYGGKSIVMHGHNREKLVSCAILQSRDGWRALSGSAKGTLQVWDLVTGAELMLLRGHSTEVRCLPLDGLRALTHSTDSTRIWNLESRQRKCTLSKFRKHQEHSGMISLGRRILAWHGCNIVTSDIQPIMDGGQWGVASGPPTQNDGMVLCCAAFRAGGVPRSL